MWALHRAWIRSLHYRSLYIGYWSYGLDQIHQILKLVWAFHALENISIPQIRQRRGEFTHFFTVVETVSQALYDFIAEFFQKTRPQPADGAYTMNETVSYNLETRRFTSPWSKVGH